MSTVVTSTISRLHCLHCFNRILLRLCFKLCVCVASGKKCFSVASVKECLFVGSVKKCLSVSVMSIYRFFIVSSSFHSANCNASFSRLHVQPSCMYHVSMTEMFPKFSVAVMLGANRVHAIRLQDAAMQN